MEEKIQNMAEKLMGSEAFRKNRNSLSELVNNTENQKLAKNIETSSLQKAFEKGDQSAIRKELSNILATPDGKKLMEKVSSFLR